MSPVTREQANKWQRVWYARNRLKERSRLRERHKKQRKQAIQNLGGCCSQCGDSREDVLQFDHIVPVGQGREKKATHREVLQCSDPSEVFQLLCANCHVLKTRSNREYGGKVHTINGLEEQECAEDSQLVLF